MNIEVIRTLFDYNYWAHRKVWDCIMELSSEQFTQHIPYSMGSVHSQVVHSMSAEWIWLSRLCGNAPTSMLTVEEYPTRGLIRQKWDNIEADMRAYLDAITEDQLHQTFDYQQTDGTPRQDKILDILLHVVNHGTDHRAQILRILGDFGAPTIAQDIIFYMREKRGES